MLLHFYKILYKCPKCKAEHTLFVDNDTIVCSTCGFRARVDEYYDLVDSNGNVYPFDIDKWFKWQRARVAEQIKDDGFDLTLSGKICTLRLDKLKKAPDDKIVLSVGRVTLNKEGLIFCGELNGEAVNFDFPAKSIYSLTCSFI